VRAMGVQVGPSPNSGDFLLLPLLISFFKKICCRAVVHTQHLVHARFSALPLSYTSSLPSVSFDLHQKAPVEDRQVTPMPAWAQTPASDTQRHCLFI
jgi:hypothetical protein